MEHLYYSVINFHDHACRSPWQPGMPPKMEASTMNVVMSLTEMEMSSDVLPLDSEEGIICVVHLHKIDSEKPLHHTQVNTFVIHLVACVVH